MVFAILSLIGSLHAAMKHILLLSLLFLAGLKPAQACLNEMSVTIGGEVKDPEVGPYLIPLGTDHDKKRIGYEDRMAAY